MFSFFKRKSNKPVIVAIHGFGKRRTDQLIPLKEYFESQDYEVLCPTLFTCEDENDCKKSDWLKRAEDCVDEQLALGKEVVLVGFSMGGVIASYLAAKRRIKRLILLAPAFTYVTLNNVTNTVTKKLKPATEEKVTVDGYTPLPTNFYSTFCEIVDTHKEDIRDIICPILLFHGMEDEMIPYSSSRRIVKKIKNKNPRLVLINDADHHLLDNEVSSKIVLTLSKDFIENKLD